MQLIVGHTTHDSASIWVRGGRKDRRLEVELETIPCALCSQTKFVMKAEVKVDAKRDYTGVACFDSVLKPCTTYKVLLRSATSFREVEGQLRTFPEPGKAYAFHFLHGSCNLPTARLTALGSMAVGLLGTAATNNALKLPFTDWDVHRLPCCLRWMSWPGIRRLSRFVVKYMNFFVLGFTRQTRFEQPKPLLPSPFQQVLENAVYKPGAAGRPAFMIHCGDQIYFDVDFPERRGEKEDYRRNYRQAWFDDEDAATLLASMPHYMILDDHEISDGFGTDPDEEYSEEEKYRGPALAAYDEYVAARQPQPDQRDRLYYTFRHGDAGFFVLDTRTERCSVSEKMISDKQLAELEKWLRGDQSDVDTSDNDYALRFVVSSVPFVAQLRPPGFDANGERRPDEQPDKWSGAPWKTQRERIIAAIHTSGAERLIFLVGDMHCTYHAKMQIGLPHDRVTVHELAGGPINQLVFAKRDQFYARYSGAFTIGEGPTNQKTLPWTSTLEAFHGAAPSVLKVSVTPPSESSALEVQWEAMRTYQAGDRNRPNLVSPDDPHNLCGRIRFHRQPTESP